MQEPFEMLSPPSGGVEGLRKKLETFENRSSAFSAWGPSKVAAAAMIVACILVGGYRVLPLNGPPPQDYGIFQRYMEAPPEEAVSLVGSESAQLRLVQQPTSNPAVKLYWIEDLDD